MQYGFEEYCSDAIRTESAHQPLVDAVLERGLSGRLYHSIVGISTEINEIYDGLENKNYSTIDKINILEELGDVAWYLAIAYDELRTFDAVPSDIHIDNIGKSPIIEMRKASANLLDHSKKVMFYGKSLDRELVNINFNAVSGLLAEAITMCGGTVTNVLQTNINKLKARYPEKFSEDLAESRDLAAERNVLESGLK